MRVLDRIDASTTLDEIGLACGRYGVTKFDVQISPGDHEAFVIVMRSVGRATIGKGTTLHEAFDDALARLIHRIGANG